MARREDTSLHLGSTSREQLEYIATRRGLRLDHRGQLAVLLRALIAETWARAQRQAAQEARGENNPLFGL